LPFEGKVRQGRKLSVEVTHTVTNKTRKWGRDEAETSNSVYEEVHHTDGPPWRVSCNGWKAGMMMDPGSAGMKIKVGKGV
jgi:hypothetical protein